MNPLTAGILLAEDDEMDVVLLRRAFKDAELSNPLEVVADGQSAIDYLEEKRTLAQIRLPALLILDLQMPRRTGMDVLRWRSEQPILRTLPVFVFSSSANRDDVEQAYTLGANGYIVKPPSLAERLNVARFIKQWLHLNRVPLVSAEGFAAAQLAHATRHYSGSRE